MFDLTKRLLVNIVLLKGLSKSKLLVWEKTLGLLPLLGVYDKQLPLAWAGTKPPQVGLPIFTKPLKRSRSSRKLLRAKKAVSCEDLKSSALGAGELWLLKAIYWGFTVGKD